ncbi:MAG: MFS transporter [Alphaproteobacteria bacterium]|nr:MFS transporter [Alphaproteobacteria bacterium]
MAQVVKIYALLLGSALLMFGGGLQGLLMSVRGAEEGFSLIALGLIGTGWSIGFVAGSVSVPLLVRRVGHIRTYSVMSVMGGMTILLNLLWINDVGWIVTRAFSGFCFAGAAMVVESWLNEVSDNKSRGTMFSVYVTINMAASTIGQLAMSITGTAGYLPFVIGALAFMGAVLPTAVSTIKQPNQLASARLDLRLLIRTSPVAVVAAFAVGMTNGTFGTLAPVYGFMLGLNAASIAVIMALPAVAAALAQIPLGRLSDNMDRRYVLIGTSLVAALVGIVAVVFNPGDGWLLYALFGFYGLAAYPVYAIAVAHANDHARDGEFAVIASGMLLIYGTALAVGPILASFIMEFTGPIGMFMVTATFHLLLAGFAFLRIRMRDPVPAEARAPFLAVPLGRNATPETVAFDPRADETVASAESVDEPMEPAPDEAAKPD